MKKKLIDKLKFFELWADRCPQITNPIIKALKKELQLLEKKV